MNETRMYMRDHSGAKYADCHRHEASRSGSKL